MASVDYSFFPTGLIYPEDRTWDRFKHYLRDKSLVQYGASLIGENIQKAAGAVVGSIRDMTEVIGAVGNKVCEGLQDINDTLSALNRRADMMIEQQRMTNLLLHDIAELLKIPNSEKERRQAINNGIRFLSNAGINHELYSDALEEFLKAESYQRQDFFVLHRIGSIYLFSEENLDPVKAMDYFVRAAKYAKVDSSPEAIRMADILTNTVSTSYTQTVSNVSNILGLASDSYEKAAFAAYVNDNLDLAIEYQTEANALSLKPQGLFFLSKYYAHESKIESSLQFLEKATDGAPQLGSAVFQEVDMMIQPEIMRYLDDTDKEVKTGLERYVHDLKGKMSTTELEHELKDGTFASRYRTYKRYKRKLK